MEVRKLIDFRVSKLLLNKPILIKLQFLCITVLLIVALAISMPLSAYASTTRRVDVSPIGSPDSSNPRMSQDGRVIAFDTSTDDLFPGDLNDREDVLAFDRTNDVTKRVSLDENNQPFDANCFINGISGDGRYVLFAADQPNEPQIYLRDLESQTSEKLTISYNGLPIQISSPKAAAITPDARYIALYGQAEDESGDTGDQNIYIYVHDRQNDLTERVSVTETQELPNNDSTFDQWQPISDDGRYITFFSSATNIVSPDQNDAEPDVFLFDRTLGTTTRVNQSASGEVVNNSFSSAISGNGTFITFTTFGEGTFNQYMKNRISGELTRIGLGSSNIDLGTGPDAAFSSDGQYLAFRSLNYDLVDGDTNDAHDIFRMNTTTGEILRISYANNSEQGSSFDGSITMSGDGRAFAFSSSDQLVDGDTNDTTDIFIRDLALSEFEIAPQQTVTTDEPPSAAEPIQTAVTSPVEGQVIIHEQQPTYQLPGQYSILNQEAQISAPTATVEEPLVLTFRLDSTAVDGTSPNAIEVFRNGAAVANCTTSDGTATPNPCVSSRVLESDGDVSITVLTSQASVWNFAKKLRPVTKEDCKGGGWQLYIDFRNQGNCVSSLEQNN